VNSSLLVASLNSSSSLHLYINDLEKGVLLLLGFSKHTHTHTHTHTYIYIYSKNNKYNFFQESRIFLNKSRVV